MIVTSHMFQPREKAIIMTTISFSTFVYPECFCYSPVKPVYTSIARTLNPPTDVCPDIHEWGVKALLLMLPTLPHLQTECIILEPDRDMIDGRIEG